MRAALPELPAAKEARYRETFGLSPVEAAALADDRTVAGWFDRAVEAGGRPKTVANWLLNDLFRLLNERGRMLMFGSMRNTPFSMSPLFTSR